MAGIRDLSQEKINEKLSAVKEEHSELNKKCDELASKTYITPEEEMQLKRLRKMKLYKKDMISYLSTMLSNTN